MSTVLFTELVDQATQMAAALETEVSAELLELAPSVLTAHAIDTPEVTLVVPAGHELWSTALETAIRESVATQLDPISGGCALVVRTG